MSIQEWLILIGALLIGIIIFDGVRRVRQRRSQLRLEIEQGLADLPADDYGPELPNGGARVVTRKPGDHEEPTFSDPLLDGQAASDDQEPHLTEEGRGAPASPRLRQSGPARSRAAVEPPLVTERAEPSLSTEQRLDRDLEEGVISAPRPARASQQGNKPAPEPSGSQVAYAVVGAPASFPAEDNRHTMDRARGGERAPLVGASSSVASSQALERSQVADNSQAAERFDGTENDLAIIGERADAADQPRAASTEMPRREAQADEAQVDEERDEAPSSGEPLGDRPAARKAAEAPSVDDAGEILDILLDDLEDEGPEKIRERLEEAASRDAESGRTAQKSAPQRAPCTQEREPTDAALKVVEAPMAQVGLDLDQPITALLNAERGAREGRAEEAKEPGSRPAPPPRPSSRKAGRPEVQTNFFDADPHLDPMRELELEIDLTPPEEDTPLGDADPLLDMDPLLDLDDLEPLDEATRPAAQSVGGAPDADAPRAERPKPSEDEVLVITVTARGEPFPGGAIRKLAEACGMRHGDMDIFHRQEDAIDRGAIQFSLANAVKPGTFALDQLEQLRTPAVSLFMAMPEPRDCMNAFDCMLATAQCLAQNLGGELKDENRSVLRPQTIEHYRQRIRDFELHRLSRRG